MATWKKVIVSGSNISELVNDSNYLTTVDISADTNLSGGTNLTLNGDAMDLDANITLTSVTADLTGNVTGDLTGSVLGDVTGNVTGDVTGNATSADALSTARSFTTTGDVVLTSQTFDGSSDFTTTATIQSNAVENSMMADDSVDSAEIVAGAIDAEHLGTSAKSAISGAFAADSASFDTRIGTLETGAYDLDFRGDTGGALVIEDGETLEILGGTNIATTGSGNQLTINLDSTITADLTGTASLASQAEGINVNSTNAAVDHKIVFVDAAGDDKNLTTDSTSGDFIYRPSSGKLTVPVVVSQLSGGVTGSLIGDVTGDLTGTASLATKAETLNVDTVTTNGNFDIVFHDGSNGIDQGAAGELAFNPNTNELTVGGNIAANGGVTGNLSGTADTASYVAVANIDGDIALGTNTSGNYVANLGSGTGVTIGSNSGEGSTPTISVDYGTTANTALEGNTTVDDVSVANLKTRLAGGFGSNAVTIGDSDDVVTIGNNLVVTGDLTVNGDNIVANVTNLAVDDRYILLNSGSASGDSGIVFGGSLGTANSGMALILDDTDDRLVVRSNAFDPDSNSDATLSAANHYSVAGVFEGSVSDAATAKANKVGNIRVDSEEIYIWV